MQTYGLSPEWIQRLKDNCNIVSVVSKYVNLQAKGRNYWACCPFHYEKTPSFTVDEYNQFYKCFGCGVGGDVITFVQKMESCDFYDACKILAKDCGMEMPTSGTLDQNIIKQKKQMDTCYNLLRDLARYYYDNLKTPDGQAARSYLSGRGVTPETINAFGIGCSTGWTESVKFLKEKGYTYEDMEAAGVVSNHDGKYIDFYGGRLIFPVINVRGDVVGFSGRVLGKTDMAKYKNTPATMLFDKSRLVFGINLLKKEKQANGLDEIIIVEGQMDVIALWQAGIKNVVACMGTAMTPNHVKELKKLCNHVVLCFDGDGAGIKATFHSIDTLYNSGIETFVITIPGGEDPDEYIKSHGVEEFRKLLDGKKYWAQFLIDHYAANLDKTNPNSIAKFVSNALSVVRKLPTESEQFIYLDTIKNLTNISISVLRDDLYRTNTKTNTFDKKAEDSDKNDEVNSDILPNGYVKAVNHILACMIADKPYRTNIPADIRDCILDSTKLKLFDYILGEYDKSGRVIIGNIYTNFDVENSPEIADVLNYNIDPSIDTEEYFNGCIRTLKSLATDRHRQRILDELRVCRDAARKRELLSELNKLAKIQK